MTERPARAKGDEGLAKIWDEIENPKGEAPKLTRKLVNDFIDETLNAPPPPTHVHLWGGQKGRKVCVGCGMLDFEWLDMCKKFGWKLDQSDIIGENEKERIKNDGHK